jgi:alkylhydroperoxidase/carboxymuconolactone decarboxylase family protein YurZ
MTKKKEPGIYLTLKKQHPALVQAVESLRKTARNEGPLDEATVHLIQLAAAAAIRSEGAVHSHVRRALDAGGDASAIRHAIIVLTTTIGFPNMVAALSWAEDVMPKKK